MSEYDDALDIAREGRERINASQWSLCYTCIKVFGRKRETNRYCSECGRGYCEGEHGTFAHHTGRSALCLTCLLEQID